MLTTIDYTIPTIRDVFTIYTIVVQEYWTTQKTKQNKINVINR